MIKLTDRTREEVLAWCKKRDYQINFNDAVNYLAFTAARDDELNGVFESRLIELKEQNQRLFLLARLGMDMIESSGDKSDKRKKQFKKLYSKILGGADEA